MPINDLVATGLSNRPELARTGSLSRPRCERLRRERYAPLMPSVLLGVSQGWNGGGVGGNLENFGDRFDGDAVAWWELRNLGFGEQAAREVARSQVAQARAQEIRMMDQVASEVVQAHAQVTHRANADRNRPKRHRLGRRFVPPQRGADSQWTGAADRVAAIRASARRRSAAIRPGDRRLQPGTVHAQPRARLADRGGTMNSTVVVSLAALASCDDYSDHSGRPVVIAARVVTFVVVPRFWNGRYLIHGAAMRRPMTSRLEWD